MVVDEVIEIARQVMRQNQEEGLQAIEKKLHITGEREGVRCHDYVRKHLANVCPLRKPRAPLNPPRNPNYCHICRRHGHDTDECFYNAKVGPILLLCIILHHRLTKILNKELTYPNHKLKCLHLHQFYLLNNQLMCRIKNL